jgi:hypothetical protein
MRLLLLNYSHPLTEAQLAQAGALAGEPLEVRDIAVQIDRARPIADVADELAEAAKLAPDEWQTLGLILNPPGLAPLALALIAELHGRSGHFPVILNIRPVADTTLILYEVAELVNLQALRDVARTQRTAQ